ncbi:hypothetical protein KAW18_02570 [candidate division WOR-3 bacterium]|nr:hypothetical protein [candidate division WOR-3 bacterium]
MNTQRKTSINIALTIIKDLMNGKHLKVGDQTIVMSNDGCVGYVLSLHGGVVANDITIRELAELVEKYEIIPIPEVGK